MAADTARVDAIQSHFAPLIGKRIISYRTAELRHDDGTWSSCPDLPIRIMTDDSLSIGISWSCFDDLTLTRGDNDPAWAGAATTRWVENSIEAINDCLGRVILGVSLGRGQMAIGGREIEIWTRLLIDLGDCWLEIFNALDENGYCLHHDPPSEDMVKCICLN